MLKIIPAVLFAVTIATPAASTLTEREVAYCDHHPGWNGTAEELIIVQGLWLYCAAHPEAREIGDTQHTLARLVRGGAAQNRMHPGEQFLDAERLDDIIVSTGPQAADAVVGGIAGGEEDDRHLRAGRSQAMQYP